jgi:hypothetical protein
MQFYTNKRIILILKKNEENHLIHNHNVNDIICIPI